MESEKNNNTRGFVLSVWRLPGGVSARCGIMSAVCTEESGENRGDCAGTCRIGREICVSYNS